MTTNGKQWFEDPERIARVDFHGGNPDDVPLQRAEEIELALPGALRAVAARPVVAKAKRPRVAVTVSP